MNIKGLCQIFCVVLCVRIKKLYIYLKCHIFMYMLSSLDLRIVKRYEGIVEYDKWRFVLVEGVDEREAHSQATSQ